MHSCTKGDDSYKGEFVLAAGHKWGEWSVTKPASYNEEGIETRTCGACQESETREIEKLAYGYTVNNIEVNGESITVSLTKSSDAAGVLIAASYSDNGTLIDVELKDIALTEENDNIELELKTDGAEYVSAYIWDNMKSMKPISEKKSKYL